MCVCVCVRERERDSEREEEERERARKVEEIFKKKTWFRERKMREKKDEP